MWKKLLYPTCYIATVFKMDISSWTNKSMKHNGKTRDNPTQMWTTDFWQKCKSNQMEKGYSSENGVRFLKN